MLPNGSLLFWQTLLVWVMRVRSLSSAWLKYVPSVGCLCTKVWHHMGGGGGGGEGTKFLTFTSFFDFTNIKSGPSCNTVKVIFNLQYILVLHRLTVTEVACQLYTSLLSIYSCAMWGPGLLRRGYCVPSSPTPPPPPPPPPPKHTHIHHKLLLLCILESCPIVMEVLVTCVSAVDGLGAAPEGEVTSCASGGCRSTSCLVRRKKLMNSLPILMYRWTTCLPCSNILPKSTVSNRDGLHNSVFWLGQYTFSCPFTWWDKMLTGVCVPSAIRQAPVISPCWTSKYSDCSRVTVSQWKPVDCRSSGLFTELLSATLSCTLLLRLVFLCTTKSAANMNGSVIALP